MARKRRKNTNTPGELNLTAMIDIAFQLLSFFIITVKPVDVMAHLNVFRPAPDARPTENAQPAEMIRITVFPDGYQVNEKTVSTSQLEAILAKLSSLDHNQTVLIQCLNLSPHAMLVALLDICVKYKLTNLSVVSSGGA